MVNPGDLQQIKHNEVVLSLAQLSPHLSHYTATSCLSPNSMNKDAEVGGKNDFNFLFLNGPSNFLKV